MATLTSDFECPVHGQTIVVDEVPYCATLGCTEHPIDPPGERPMIYHFDAVSDLKWLRTLISAAATDLSDGTGEISGHEARPFRQAARTIDELIGRRNA